MARRVEVQVPDGLYAELVDHAAGRPLAPTVRDLLAVGLASELVAAALTEATMPVDLRRGGTTGDDPEPGAYTDRVRPLF